MERTLKRFEVTRLLVLPDSIAVVVASEVGSLVVVGEVVVPEMQERAIVTFCQKDFNATLWNSPRN